MILPNESPESRLPTDEGFPLSERFPRQLWVAFRANEQSEMTLHLECAEPNPFVDGPIDDYLGTGKRQGFIYGQIGDSLTDRTYNSNDPYGLHDALHLGVLTATGWSAVMRQLLGLRRYSDSDTRKIDDGPRALLAEEQILNSYAKELLRDGPIPRTIGSVSLDAVAQVKDFLPPGTAISAEAWEDGLRLGGTLMFLLQSLGTESSPDRTHHVLVDLDARDMYLSDEAKYNDSDKGTSIRNFVRLLTPPKRDLFRQQYGTLMGIDGKGQAWYLRID